MLAPYGNMSADFGDAPGSGYATLLSNNAARHRIVPGYHLGDSIDHELDGQPSIMADGDDSDDDGNDDDGVTVGSLVVGQLATMDIVVSADGYVDGWFDWDSNGVWEQSEYVSSAVSAGINSLQLSVPVDAALGASFARIRFSSVGGLTFDGPAADGEVEDYAIDIVSPASDLEAQRRITRDRQPQLQAAQ